MIDQCSLLCICICPFMFGDIYLPHAILHTRRLVLKHWSQYLFDTAMTRPIVWCCCVRIG
jgi:hypothetical protein